jgi:hypothetical protein
MRKFIILAAALLGLAACGTASDSTRSQVMARSQVQTMQAGIPACMEYMQRDCIRLDLPSVLEGNIPSMLDGTPDGPKTLAAVEAGTVQHAGRREYVAFVWGMPNEVTAGHLAQYAHRRGSLPTRTSVVEVDPRNAPIFDPAHRPPGKARAFRFTSFEHMVSFQLPKAGVSYVLICPEGRSLFPNRQTAENGLWTLPEFFDLAREGKFNRGTRKPVIWQRK